MLFYNAQQLQGTHVLCLHNYCLFRCSYNCKLNSHVVTDVVQMVLHFHLAVVSLHCASRLCTDLAHTIGNTVYSTPYVEIA